MAFELFSPDKATPRGLPMVTVTRYGRIALNKTATHRLEKAHVNFVHLLWDEENLTVGIKPAEKDRATASLSYGTNGNGVGFSSIPFLMFIKYDWTVTRNFEAVWNDDHQMYTFQVSEQFLGSEISGEHLKETLRQNRLKKQKTSEEVS